jgi:hypothetical protein
MGDREFLSDQFDADVKAACIRAREETLSAGVAVFYWDAVAGTDVMEQADGRRFEIRFIPDAPRERNYLVLGELGRTAA